MATDENGPGGETGPVEDEHAGERDVTTRVRHPFIVAVEMLAESADRERAIAEAMWTEGYRAGFETGAEVGRGQAAADIDRAWADLATKIRRTASTPKHAELELIRWDGRREDFGRPRPGDHPGGPVDYDTGRPLGRGSAA